MKKRALFLVVACAMMLSAQPVFAVGTCQDWADAWTLNYGSKCDNVTFTVCENPNPSISPDASTPTCMPNKAGELQSYFNCVARGKRQSDNKTVQIRMIFFDKSVWSYYEKTDEEVFVLGSSTPADYIPVALFDGTSFFVDNSNAPSGGAPPANSGLASGKKGKGLPCDNGTTTLPCQMKIIPKKIHKLVKLTEPISAIVLISDGKAEFTADDTPKYDTTAIIPLLKVKIGTKIMISIVLVNPLSKDSGTYDVTVGDCSGAIQVQ